jgi:hypothetical protein
MLLLLLLACDGGDDSVALETPTISFLSPVDGGSVAVGDLQLSIVIEHFALQDPAKHNAGEPEGFVRVAWTDGSVSESRDAGSTTPTIEIPSSGNWTITAALHYADGDEITDAFPDYTPAEVIVTAE